MHYARRSAGQVLFEIQMGFVSRGASIAWLSQYPSEAEILFPPRASAALDPSTSGILPPPCLASVRALPCLCPCSLSQQADGRTPLCAVTALEVRGSRVEGTVVVVELTPTMKAPDGLRTGSEDVRAASLAREAERREMAEFDAKLAAANEVAAEAAERAKWAIVEREQATRERVAAEEETQRAWDGSAKVLREVEARAASELTRVKQAAAEDVRRLKEAAAERKRADDAKRRMAEVRPVAILWNPPSICFHRHPPSPSTTLSLVQVRTAAARRQAAATASALAQSRATEAQMAAAQATDSEARECDWTRSPSLTICHLRSPLLIFCHLRSLQARARAEAALRTRNEEVAAARAAQELAEQRAAVAMESEERASAARLEAMESSRRSKVASALGATQLQVANNRAR